VTIRTQRKDTALDQARTVETPSGPLAVRFDDGRHARAKIGYVLLATEQTIQDDVMRLRPVGVGMHFSRIAIPDSITVESLSTAADGLTEAARLILPDGSLDVVAYACTSGSLVVGEDRVHAALAAAQPQAKATSLIAGVIRALRAFGARRIAVGTPYVDPINAMEADYMAARGFEVADITGLGLKADSDMVRLTPNFLADFARAVDRPDADAVFISCGALRTLDIVDAVERDLGKPVICSNQAMLWDTLRLAGVEDRIPGAGRLLREH
jgi:maleate isomerase